MDEWLTGVRRLDQIVEDNTRLAERRIRDLRVTVSVLEGRMRMTMAGDHRVLSVDIDPKLYRRWNPDALADKIIDAHGKALTAVERAKHTISLGILGMEGTKK